MIRNLSATFLFLALHLTSSAQDLDYFAELNAPLSFGDSRFNALAGNMVGMSGSLTALALNPATVGLYRQDAFLRVATFSIRATAAPTEELSVILAT